MLTSKNADKGTTKTLDHLKVNDSEISGSPYNRGGDRGTLKLSHQHKIGHTVDPEGGPAKEPHIKEKLGESGAS